MLRLGSRPADSADATAVEMLLACHERIRTYAAMAVQLADENLAAPGRTVSASAAEVHRYFAEALPLHVEDEDRLLLPRLAGVPEVAGPLALMSDQHREIEARLARLFPAWSEVMADPARRTVLVERRGEALALRELLLAHLESEEACVLPALAKYCPPSSLAALLQEMRALRR